MDDERSFTVEIPIRPRELPRRDPAPVGQVEIEGVNNHSPFENHFRLSQPQHQQSKCPEGLKIISGAFGKTFRDRSPTASTISSTHVPDSATTCSMPMSPTSSTFTRATTPDIDGPERLHTPFLATRSGRNGHRYRESCDSGSTFVDSIINEERFPAYPESISMGRKDDPLRQVDINEPEDDGQNDMHHTAGTPRPPARDEAPESPFEAPLTIPYQPLSDRMSFDSGSDRLSRAWEPVSPTPVDFSDEEADAVLDYVLQVTYGVELDEVNMPPPFLRHFALRFMQDIGSFAFAGLPVATQLTHTTSTSSNGSVPLASRSGSGRGSQNGKRKKGEAGRLDGGDDGDDLTDDDGDSSAPFKRARPTPREAEENLRLSCPFRKRNPHRFNVREHHSCAMTYFPKFAELRQHIVKQHKRNDSSSFICDRCNRDFPSKRELRDHQRLPREQMCDVSDHDPESGIDGPTMTKLLSRKRASGMTPEVQWREIWNLLFPDDDDYRVQPFDFCPVIEHFELQAKFMNSLKDVEDSLRDKGMTQQALETIGDIYRNQFIQVIEQCIADSQMMPYSNRSNRKNDPSPSNLVTRRHSARSAPRPDSGVDVDASSEDSQSVAVFPGGLLDGQVMLAHSDSVRTVRRVSSTSSEFRNSALPRTLQPLMEQLESSGQGIRGSHSPRQKLSPSQQQQQQMTQLLMPNQQADFTPMMSGVTPEMAAQLWTYHDANIETRSPPGQMSMYPPEIDTSGQNQFPGWNSGLQDYNGLYNFSGYMPR